MRGSGLQPFELRIRVQCRAGEGDEVQLIRSHVSTSISSPSIVSVKPSSCTSKDTAASVYAGHVSADSHTRSRSSQARQARSPRSIALSVKRKTVTGYGGADSTATIQ